jgi:hypothetical protein
MIVRSFASLLLSSVLAVALAACGRGGWTATLDAPIQLAPGQSAEFAAEKLEVKFVDIAEDSRCPSDVTCLWAGEVIVRLTIRIDGRTQELSIKETQSRAVDSYAVSVLEVLPARATSQPIAPVDYRVTLKVTRSNSQ